MSPNGAPKLSCVVEKHCLHAYVNIKDREEKLIFIEVF